MRKYTFFNGKETGLLQISATSFRSALPAQPGRREDLQRCSFVFAFVTTILLQLGSLPRHATPAMSTTSRMEKTIRRRSSVPKDFGTTAHELNTLDQSPSSTTHVQLDRQTIRRLVMTRSDDHRLAIIRVLRVLHVSSRPIRG